MKVVLANGESVVKTWNYAISAKDAEKQQSNLTITSRRLITTVDGKNACKRTEIELSSIKSIDGCFKKNSNGSANAQIFFGMLIMLVLIAAAVALFLNVIPLAFLEGKDIIKYAVGGVLIVLGLLIGFLMIKSGVRKKKACYFRLLITTKEAEGTPIEIGGATNEKDLKKKKKGVAINVNKETARAILEELGAAVWATRNLQVFHEQKTVAKTPTVKSAE